MSFWKSVLGICETPPLTRGWYVESGEAVLDLDAAPALRRPGGAARLEGTPLPDRLLVVHGTDGRFHAYVNRCTHMGRRIDPAEAGGELRCCSVSHSRFGYDGQPAAGPAKKSLTVLPVRSDGDRLRLTLPG
jgi:nitrite reductase/ring-hydroxylating ferredoxin subunit